jgi:uncharacterized protein YecE (DUF72 family)
VPHQRLASTPRIGIGVDVGVDVGRRAGYTGAVTVLVGTSGWQYRDWRGAFYPPGVAQAKWLDHYSSRFPTVEVNNTFYRLPPASTFEKWHDATPADFVIAVKASRYLTHVRRLRDPSAPVALLLERAKPLRAKLGPVLVQLPPTLHATGETLDALDATFRAFERTKVAFEPRHESWFTDGVYALLREHDAALCLTDRLSRPGPIARTASWFYLRFHEGTASPHPCYGRQALATWVTRLHEHWGPRAEGYVYFNNDGRSCAPRDAARFAAACADAGFHVARAPAEAECPLADS